MAADLGGENQVRVANDPTLVAVGQRHDASPYEVALAWLLTKSPAIIPIPGASKVASALSSVRAASLILDTEVTQVKKYKFGEDRKGALVSLILQRTAGVEYDRWRRRRGGCQATSVGRDYYQSGCCGSINQWHNTGAC